MALIIHLLVKWAVISGVFVGLAIAMPAFRVGARLRFALAAVTFGAANILLGWVLGFALKALIFLPNLLTLGLLGLLVPVVVNAALLKAVDVKFGEALEIKGFQPLLAAAAVISVAGFLVDKLV